MAATEEICDLVIAAARDCGEVALETVGASIELRAPTTFAVLSVKARWVELRLRLATGRSIPGIVKLLSGGSDVEEHTLRLRKPADVDIELRGWLCEAHAAAGRG